MKLSVNGREAYAYTGGKTFDPALPCIVFLHGAGHDHSPWALLARWFAHHGHGVLAVDLPGHMRSAGPPLPDVETLAAWVLALLDAAGVARAALVGHSMGSLIALEAAAKAPAALRPAGDDRHRLPDEGLGCPAEHGSGRAGARDGHGQRLVDLHPGHQARRSRPRATGTTAATWRCGGGSRPAPQASTCSTSTSRCAIATPGAWKRPRA